MRIQPFANVCVNCCFKRINPALAKCVNRFLLWIHPSHFSLCVLPIVVDSCDMVICVDRLSLWNHPAHRQLQWFRILSYKDALSLKRIISPWLSLRSGECSVPEVSQLLRFRLMTSSSLSGFVPEAFVLVLLSFIYRGRNIAYITRIYQSLGFPCSGSLQLATTARSALICGTVPVIEPTSSQPELELGIL